MSEFAESFHKLTTAVTSQLIAFLQVKYRATQTPFATHPTTMLLACMSFIIHSLLHFVLLRSPTGRFAAVAERFLVWSGYAAVATLAAAVLPDGAAPFLYATFALLSAGEVLYMFDCNPVIEEEEEGGLRFEVYRRRVCGCLKRLCCGRVAKFFRKHPPPPIPIT